MEELDCKSVRPFLWDYAANSLGKDAAWRIEAHLGVCRECELRHEEVQSVRSGLKSLPFRNPPVFLETKLRVLASRDRSRRLVRRDFAAWLADRKARAALLVDHLLKPFAVPAAGGILCSFLCFGIIVNTLHLHYDTDWQNDIPIGISTEVAIDQLSPFTFNGDDVMVQLTIDSEGRVTDYYLPQKTNASPEELQQIGNLVLFSTFTPATRDGRRVSSKRMFYLGHISVKG